MSGGSWDYAYRHVDDIAALLLSSPDIRRRHLGLVVRDVAKALHDIEWVDSGDYAPGDELAAIDRVVRTASNDLVREMVRDLMSEVGYLADVIGWEGTS